MRKAIASDKAQVIAMLSLAFENNRSVTQLTGLGRKRKKRLKHLVSYVYRNCHHFGKVLIGDEGRSCAMVLFPDRKRFSLKTLLWDLELVIRVVPLSGLFKLLRKEALLERLRPKQPLYYLWWIGVSPEQQGQGLGGRLLEELCRDAELMRRLVCLETSTPENLPWYQKHGFELYQVLETGKFPLYLFRRDQPITAPA